MATGIVCPICQNDFQDPVFIECHHSFCRPCISALIHNNATNNTFLCPVCRESNTLPEFGVAGLKSCFYVELLRDAIRNARPMAHYPYCTKHGLEDLRFYCLKCNVPACRDCKVTEHENHRFEIVDNVAKRMRRQLKRSADVAQENKKKCAKINDELHSISNDIIRQRDSLIDECYQQADILKGLIDELAKDTECEIKDIFKFILQINEQKSQHVLAERNKLEFIIDSVSELTKKKTSNFDIVSNFEWVSELNHSFDVPVKNAELVKQNYKNVFCVGKPNVRELQGMLGEVRDTRELQDKQRDEVSGVDLNMIHFIPETPTTLISVAEFSLPSTIGALNINNEPACGKTQKSVVRFPKIANVKQSTIIPSDKRGKCAITKHQKST